MSLRSSVVVALGLGSRNPTVRDRDTEREKEREREFSSFKSVILYVVLGLFISFCFLFCRFREINLDLKF